METEGQAPQRIADGCALHGGEPFTAICRQCGTYMCKRCNEDGRFDRCERCRNEGAAVAARPAAAPVPGEFPFRRDGVEWGRFLRFCFELYTKNFGLLTLTMIAFFGSQVALQAIGGVAMMAVPDFALSSVLWSLFSLLYLVAICALILGVLKISLRVARGQPADISLLWTGLPRVGAFVLVGLALGAALFGLQLLLLAVFGLGFASFDGGDATLGTLLIGVVLGVLALGTSAYVSLGLVFAGMELADKPETSVLDALKNAWRIAHGERLTLGFGLFLISLLLGAGLLMCGIGVIFTLGYAAVLFAALYLALRNGAPLDPR